MPTPPVIHEAVDRLYQTLRDAMSMGVADGVAAAATVALPDGNRMLVRLRLLNPPRPPAVETPVAA